MLLTVLGGLAEFERSLIQARTSEGRERAIMCKIGVEMNGYARVSTDGQSLDAQVNEYNRAHGFIVFCALGRSEQTAWKRRRLFLRLINSPEMPQPG